MFDSWHPNVRLSLCGFVMGRSAYRWGEGGVEQYMRLNRLKIRNNRYKINKNWTLNDVQYSLPAKMYFIFPCIEFFNSLVFLMFCYLNLRKRSVLQFVGFSHIAVVFCAELNIDLAKYHQDFTHLNT